MIHAQGHGQSPVADTRQQAVLFPAADGVYLDSDTGEWIRVDHSHTPLLERMGLPTSVYRTDAGRWTLEDFFGPLPLLLSVQPCEGVDGSLVAQGYWGSRTSCFRQVGLPVRSVAPTGLVGRYWCDELGSAASVVDEKNGLALRLGPGFGFSNYGPAHLMLSAFDADHWRAGDGATVNNTWRVGNAYAIRFMRGPRRIASGFFLTANGARLIWFGRIGEPQPRPKFHDASWGRGTIDDQ